MYHVQSTRVVHQIALAPTRSRQRRDGVVCGAVGGCARRWWRWRWLFVPNASIGSPVAPEIPERLRLLYLPLGTYVLIGNQQSALRCLALLYPLLVPDQSPRGPGALHFSALKLLQLVGKSLTLPPPFRRSEGSSHF